MDRDLTMLLGIVAAVALIVVAVVVLNTHPFVFGHR